MATELRIDVIVDPTQAKTGAAVAGAALRMLVEEEKRLRASEAAVASAAVAMGDALKLVGRDAAASRGGIGAASKAFDGLSAALKREADVLESIRGPMRNYQQDAAALAKLHRDGAISSVEYATALSRARASAGIASNATDSVGKKLLGLIKIAPQTKQWAGSTAAAANLAASALGGTSAAVNTVAGAMSAFTVGGGFGLLIYGLSQIPGAAEEAKGILFNIADAIGDIATHATGAIVALDALNDAKRGIQDANTAAAGAASDAVRAAQAEFNKALAINEGAETVRRATDAYDAIGDAIDKYRASVELLKPDEQIAAQAAIARAVKSEEEAYRRLVEVKRDPAAEFNASVEARQNALLEERAAKFRELSIEVAAATGAAKQLAQVRLDNLDAGAELVNRLSGRTRDAQFAAGVQQIQASGFAAGIDAKGQRDLIKKYREEVYGRPAQKQLSDYEQYIRRLNQPMRDLVRDEGLLARAMESGAISLRVALEETKRLADLRQKLAGEDSLAPSVPEREFAPGATTGATDANTARLDAMIKQADALKETLITPLETYQAALEDINEVQALGLISQAQATELAMRAGKAYREATPEVETYASAMKAGFLSIAESATSAAEATLAIWSSAFTGIEDNLVSLVTTGKTNFSGLADDIAEAAARALVKWLALKAITSGAQALGGSVGGGGGLLDSLAGLKGFARGGSFTVGGAGGTDTTPVAFMATPGERVIVQTPDQQAQAAPNVNVGGTRVVNQMDPNAMIDVLGSGAGQRAVINTISRNAPLLRRLLRDG